jgi:F-type H+-transporting ATPase subunit epsilon
MFKLTLVTPQKRLMTDVEIEEVIVPANRGQLNILPGHAPLMTTLTAGVFKVRLKGESAFKSAAISWGYCEVNPLGVNVLAETAEWPEEVSKERAEEQLKLAHARMQQAGLAPADYIEAQRKIQKEQARIELLGR